jgi:hypothetical protein
MPKKGPERTCVACRKKGKKEEFFKVVLNKSGEVAFEKDKKLDGRGAYICKDEKCLLLAKKNRAFSRVFKTNVSLEIYEELLNEFKKGEN